MVTRMTANKPRFYDWERTLSYDADVTFVIGPRGIGKTFGIRVQCIRDYIKRGYRFVEVCRYKNEISGVADGYFEKLAELDEFSGYMFKSDNRYGYISTAIDPDSKEKPDWKKICYFVALSEFQRMKKHTFVNVKRIIFDEAILDRSDRYHRYLPNEYAILASIVDTTSRERSDTDGIKPRVYLLGNACDLANPYFAHYKVGSDIGYGYRWYDSKTFLLHMVNDADYSRQKASGTVAGRMLAGTAAGNENIYNKFSDVSEAYVERKTKNAKYKFAIIYKHKTYSVWVDLSIGRYYICDWYPRGMESTVYYLTTDDMDVNYMAASRVSEVLKSIDGMYYAGLIYYDTIDVKRGFLEVLALFGIR